MRTALLIFTVLILSAVGFMAGTVALAFVSVIGYPLFQFFGALFICAACVAAAWAVMDEM